MTHPGARPGRAGGGWAEAWSGQRERGEGPGRTAAWWGLCLLIRLAALTGDWAPAGPAPRRWVRTPGCKSVQEGPLPQVSSHLSSNFRPKVRPQPSCPLLPGPACRRQRRLWPPLPGPPSQPGLRGPPGAGLQQPRLCQPPAVRTTAAASPSLRPRFLSTRSFIKITYALAAVLGGMAGHPGVLGLTARTADPRAGPGARLCLRHMLWPRRPPHPHQFPLCKTQRHLLFGSPKAHTAT